MKILRTLTLGIITWGLALLILGCQSQQPKTPAPTPTDEVIVVVVTATTQPTIEATQPSEPTITPLATFTPIGTPVETATSAATAPATRRVATVAPGTPKPARTNAPAPTPAGKASPAAQATAAPPAPSTIKYPAPTALQPGAGGSVTSGSAMQLYFSSVGPLGTNECYLLHVWMTNPNAASGPWGEFFLDTKHCGDQSPVNARLKFDVNPPKFHWPDYGQMERSAQQAADADLLKVHWNVLVVQNNGAQADGVHYNTTPLSETSATLEFDFKP